MVVFLLLLILCVLLFGANNVLDTGGRLIAIGFLLGVGIIIWPWAYEHLIHIGVLACVMFGLLVAIVWNGRIIARQRKLYRRKKD